MARCILAGQNQLEACVQTLCDLGGAANAGILEDEHAPLRFLHGQEASRLHQQRSHIVVLPERGDDGRIRLRQHEAIEHFPQRRCVDPIEAVVERLTLGRRFGLDDEGRCLVHLNLP